MSQLRFSLALLLLALAGSTNAQTRQKLHIDAATVFLKGAELNSSATISLAKGVNEMLFTNVATGVNAASIIVNATNNVVVESAVFQQTSLRAEAPSPRITAYTDSINVLSRQRKLLELKAAVISKQLEMLDAGTDPDKGDKNISMAELTQMLELVGSKLEGYNAQMEKYNEAMADIDVRVSKLNSLISEENNKGIIPGGQLLVKFYATEAGSSNINISYMISNAGWSPLYDIIADNINKPIKFYHKANVYQNCGIKWDNVKLTLSTGNPNEGIQTPVLAPWHLAFYTPPPPAQAVASANYPRPNAQGEVVMKWKKPLLSKQPGMTLSSEEIKSLATTEVADVAGLTPNTFQRKNGQGVSVAGARKTGTLYVIDGVQVQDVGQEIQSSITQYVTVDNSGVNTTFDIDLPYSIPSDGVQHLVVVKKYDIPASYRYYTVPKIDKDVFLQAEISKWETLDLLPGPANIFFDGTYIGQGQFDSRTVKDTLQISLGRDKKILVKREQDLKKRNTRSSGTNVREQVAYTITVRNNRKYPIDLVMYDQFPVSNENGIEVEDKETSGGEENEYTGFVKWALTPQPGQSSTIKFGYTLKYPKDKTIVGLR